MHAPELPRDRGDATIAFLRDPYRFVSRRASHHASDVFRTRFAMQPVICMTGSRAAAVFYDADRFCRRAAAPGPVERTLFGRGGVQGLDGAEHEHRKALLVALTGPDRTGALVESVLEQLRSRMARQQPVERIVLYRELSELLARETCAWAGVPLPDSEAPRRIRQLIALFDAAGSVGPRHLRSRLARAAADGWAQRLMAQVRAGQLHPPDGSAIREIAAHRDARGDLLDSRTAAVELLNLIRPTVAVSVFLVFACHALARFPECRERLATGDETELARFVREVRRFYPFFPAVTARVRRDFSWNGYEFSRGQRALLDLYGTNHDPRVWEAPEQFRPERFSRDYGPFEFVPQGGGSAQHDHRCPGEPLAEALMKPFVDLFVRELDYDLPEQDLTLDMSRLPALPRSRMVISNVRARSHRATTDG